MVHAQSSYTKILIEFEILGHNEQVQTLTLSLPRGGEISPPPMKIESHSFMDVSNFFNF